jgi:hypothetical protein
VEILSATELNYPWQRGESSKKTSKNISLGFPQSLRNSKNQPQQERLEAKMRTAGPLIVCAGWTNLVWHTAILSPDDLRISQGDTIEIVNVRATLLETPGQRMFVRDERKPGTRPPA